MYVPAQFRLADLGELHEVIASAPLATLVINGDGGLEATPIPLFLDAQEGAFGTLYGHLAKVNPLRKAFKGAEALAIFSGPDAYVSPSWYATKPLTGKVVPTWNYVAVHAHGVPEFFDDAERLLATVTTLTVANEGSSKLPWAVSDAPHDYVANQIRAIVGVRLPIDRIEGKRKMSQNRNDADRAGVIDGLNDRAAPMDAAVAELVPKSLCQEKPPG